MLLLPATMLKTRCHVFADTNLAGPINVLVYRSKMKQ